MPRVSIDECGVGLGGVGIATPVEQLFAERSVQRRREARLRVLSAQIVVDGRATTERREAQAGDAQRIPRHVGTPAFDTIEQAVAGIEFPVVWQGAVEQGDEFRQGFAVARLLVQRPAMLVARVVGVRRVVTEFDGRRVLLGSFVVTTFQIELFGGAKAGIRDPYRIRIASPKLLQGLDRSIVVAEQLVGASQLIQRTIGKTILGELGKQRLVAVGRGLQVRRVALTAFEALQTQIGGTAQRLGAQPRRRVELQQSVVVGDGLLRVGLDLAGRIDAQGTGGSHHEPAIAGAAIGIGHRGDGRRVRVANGRYRAASRQAKQQRRNKRHIQRERIHERHHLAERHAHRCTRGADIARSTGGRSYRRANAKCASTR